MQMVDGAIAQQQGAAAPSNLIDRFVILGSLAVLYASILSVLYRKADQIDNWAFADWSTSYAGGFIRRGLSGEVLRLLSGLLGSQKVAFVAINALLYAVLLGFLAMKYLNYGRDAMRALLFIPTSIFFLMDPHLVGRKETLLFVLAIAIVSTIEGQAAKARPHLYWTLLGGVAAGLLFFHEALIFFYPLAFATAQIGRDGANGAPRTLLGTAKLFALFISLPVLAFLLIAALQVPVRLEAIFAAIPDGGEVLRHDCLAPTWGSRGAICYLDTPFSEALRQVWILSDWRDLLGSVCLLGLQLALALWLFAHGADLRRVAWHGPVLGLALCATLPLYAIAIDWGRWTFVITVLLALGTPRRLRGVRELANVKLLLLIPLFSLFTISDRRLPRFTLAGPTALYQIVTGQPADIEP